jgi:hypothetical protein
MTVRPTQPSNVYICELVTYFPSGTDRYQPNFRSHESLQDRSRPKVQVQEVDNATQRSPGYLYRFKPYNSSLNSSSSNLYSLGMVHQEAQPESDISKHIGIQIKCTCLISHAALNDDQFTRSHHQSIKYVLSVSA